MLKACGWLAPPHRGHNGHNLTLLITGCLVNITQHPCSASFPLHFLFRFQDWAGTSAGTGQLLFRIWPEPGWWEPPKREVGKREKKVHSVEGRCFWPQTMTTLTGNLFSTSQVGFVYFREIITTKTDIYWAVLCAQKSANIVFIYFSQHPLSWLYHPHLTNEDSREGK